MEKIRVLITVDSLNSGGTERQIIELIKGFRKTETFELSVLTLTANGYYDNIVKEYANLYALTDKPSDWKKILSFKRLYNLIKNNRFDIVHTMSLEDSSMVYFLSKVLNFKWINGSIRDSDSRRNRRQLQKRFLLKHSKFIVANSFAGLNVYSINRHRFAKVIYNGVDLNRFQVKNTMANTPTFDKVRLCSVANLSAYKDYFTLINAVELIKDLPFSLDIFGDGPMREEFEKLVLQKSLCGKITFHGRVSNIEDFLPDMDCGVLMSFKKSGEGLPNAVLEFMSSGVPVIASNVGGVSEIIKNDFNGILVEPENALLLSKTIKKIVCDKNYLTFLSSNTISSIQEKFTLDRMVDDYLNYYTEVAHG